MTVTQLMRALIVMHDDDKGGLPVVLRNSGSGACGEATAVRLTDHQNPETGPFELSTATDEYAEITF